jgi:CheY-like chemotaxis protein
VRLAQVFTNILNNACKYSDRNGRIELTAERRGDEALVTIRDSGVGIAPEHLSSVFDMFTQVDRTLERAHGGLGIGLSLVKRLVEMHGGRVTAASEGPGRGSEFLVRLPVLDTENAGTPAEAEAEAEGEGEGEAAIRGNASNGGAPRKFLIVDDNIDAATSLAMLLEIGGHEAHLAHNGKDAVERARELRPEIILLDIGLPKLNGYDACRQIRAEPWGRSIVLVALTGWGQDSDRRRSRDAGFDHHLVKPVDPDELMKLLENIQRRSG